MSHASPIYKRGSRSKEAREKTLEGAKECVLKDRNRTYGEPEDEFARTADMWSAYKGVKFDAFDVAMMQVLVKVSRARTTPGHMDNHVDIAGYAACASGVVAAAEEENEGS
jgi:hypothetical protein